MHTQTSFLSASEFAVCLRFTCTNICNSHLLRDRYVRFYHKLLEEKKHVYKICIIENIVKKN